MNMLQVESRDTHQDRSIGHLFYEERTKQALSFEAVSAHIKFLPATIKALENEEWDQLPKGFILKGLVKKYAALLNIDEAYALSLLPMDNAYQAFRTDIKEPVHTPWFERFGLLLPKLLWSGLVILLVALVIILIGWLTDSSFLDFLHLSTGSTSNE